MGTNPSPEIIYKKNWPSHSIELLGMKKVLTTAFGLEYKEYKVLSTK
jgi:hypothetical protein